MTSHGDEWMRCWPQIMSCDSQTNWRKQTWIWTTATTTQFAVNDIPVSGIWNLTNVWKCSERERVTETERYSLPCSYMIYDTMTSNPIHYVKECNFLILVNFGQPQISLLRKFIWIEWSWSEQAWSRKTAQKIESNVCDDSRDGLVSSHTSGSNVIAHTHSYTIEIAQYISFMCLSLGLYIYLCPAQLSAHAIIDINFLLLFCNRHRQHVLFFVFNSLQWIIK